MSQRRKAMWRPLKNRFDDQPETESEIECELRRLEEKIYSAPPAPLVPRWLSVTTLTVFALWLTLFLLVRFVH